MKKSLLLFCSIAISLLSESVSPMPPVMFKGRPVFPVGAYDILVPGKSGELVIDPGFLAAGGNLAYVGSLGIPGHPEYQEYRQPVLYKRLELLSGMPEAKNIALILALDHALFLQETLDENNKTAYRPVMGEEVGKRIEILAGDLGEELKGPFSAPIVGEAEGGVCRDDPHQRHVGEVVALGDHLGADEDLGLPAPEGGEDLLIGVPAGDRVRVHADGPGAGEPLLDLLLHLLRAHAEVLDEGLAAAGADGGQGLPRAAVVAADRILGLVVGHGDIAVVACQHVSAGAAGDEGGVSTPVQKQHGLVSLLQAFPEPRYKQ